MELSLPEAKYPTGQQKAAFFQQVVENVKTLPGVQSVGAVTDLPLSGSNRNYAFEIEGRPPSIPGASTSGDYRAITPDYFRTMGLPLLRGRPFTPGDDKDTLQVIIINETLARKHFAGEDPLGERVRLGFSPDSSPGVIVGVVRDVKHFGLD